MVGRSDYLTWLNERLSPERAELLRRIQTATDALNLTTSLVGGCVRDLLLGLPLGDFDFVVEGPPGDERMEPPAARLVARLVLLAGGVVRPHPAFGTAAWLSPEGAVVDFASARTETYAEPAQLPVVRLGASTLQDLARRDFTINALALGVAGQATGLLLDSFGGRADLAGRCVRGLHPATFRDDPTRMYRAVRYEQRLGFAIAPETEAWIQPALPLVARLSGERVRYELERIVAEPRAGAMLARLEALGLLRAAHPDLRWGHAQAAQAAVIASLPKANWRLAAPPNWLGAWLALLLQPAGVAAVEGVVARLAVPALPADAAYRALARPVPAGPASQVAATLEGYSEAALLAAYVAQPAARSAIDDYLARSRHVRPLTTGHDLLARGLSPGPGFGRILERLRAAWLDGELTDPAGEAALLEALLAAERGQERP